MEKSHGNPSTKPISNFQDVTNLANQEQPHENFAPDKHVPIQSNPPTRPNFEFMMPNGSHQKAWDPQTVQSEPQMRPNHSFVYPNNGYPLQAIGKNVFASGPSHQQSNEYDRQVPQQETYDWWGPQRQVNHGYNAHGSSHYERRHAPAVPRQWCQYYLQGRCQFGHACKFRHE